MDKLLLTRTDAAKALSVSVDKLDDLTHAGRIQRVTIGSHVYFDPHDLLLFVGNLKAEEGAGGETD